MARHRLIENDLKLFLDSSSEVFKKKISQRVYSPWQNSIDERSLKLIHMILVKVSEDLKNNVKSDFSWLGSLNKLEEAKYIFTSSDYFPDRKEFFYKENTELKDAYISMVEALQDKGVTIDEVLLNKFIKKQGISIHPEIVQYFKNLNFNIDAVLLEVEVENNISTLIEMGYEYKMLKDKIKEIETKELNDMKSDEFHELLSFEDDTKTINDIENYKQRQLKKLEFIRNYLNTTEISKDRALELLKLLRVSFEQMDTYPEYNQNKYKNDILINFFCSSRLKTEAFYSDVQVGFIREIEERYDIKFLEKYNPPYSQKEQSQEEKMKDLDFKIDCMLVAFIQEIFDPYYGEDYKNDKFKDLSELRTKKYRNYQKEKVQAIKQYLKRTDIDRSRGIEMINLLDYHTPQNGEIELKGSESIYSVLYDMKENNIPLPKSCYTPEQLELIDMIQERFEFQYFV